LTRAMDKAAEASREALEPKKPGRKGKSEEAQRIIELSKQQSLVEKEAKQWKVRYEIAMKYIELAEKRADQDQKKLLRAGRRAAKRIAGDGEGKPVADRGDGAGAGAQDLEPEGMEEKAGETEA